MDERELEIIVSVVSQLEQLERELKAVQREFEKAGRTDEAMIIGTNIADVRRELDDLNKRRRELIKEAAASPLRMAVQGGDEASVRREVDALKGQTQELRNQQREAKRAAEEARKLQAAFDVMARREINADKQFDKARKAAAAARNEVDTMNARLALLGRRMQEAGGQTDLSRAGGQIRSLTSELDRTERKFRDLFDTTSSSELKNSLQEGITKIQRLRAEAERTRINIEARVEIANARQQVSSLVRDLRNLDRYVTNPRITADPDEALRAIRVAEGKLESLSRKEAELRIQAAGNEEATRELESVQQAMRAVSDDIATARVRVEKALAERDLNSLQRSLVRAGLAKVVINVDVDGASRATTQMRGLAAASAFAGGSLRQNLAGQVHFTNNLLVLMGRYLIFAAVAGLGPLTAAATLAGAAIAGLAAGFGVLLAGALPSISALSGHESATKSLEAAQDSAKSAQDAYNDSTRGVAEAQLNAARAVEDATEAYHDSVRAVGEAQRAAREGVGDAISSYRDALSALAETDRSTRQAVSDSRRAYADAVRGYADAERQAHERVADAIESLRDAQASLVETRSEVARSVAQAYESYRDAVVAIGEAERAARQQAADAHRSYQDAVRATADAERQARESVASALENYRASVLAVAEAQRQAEQGVAAARQAARDAIERVADAEESLRDARTSLLRSTQAITSAQRDYNQALRDEPTRQLELSLDLQEARLREREIAQRVAEAEAALASARGTSGGVTNAIRMAEEALNRARLENDPEQILRAEQALAAARAGMGGDVPTGGTGAAVNEIERMRIELERLRIEQQRNAIEQQRAQEAINEARRNGTDELQRARDALVSAYEQQRDAAERVQDAEEALRDSRVAAAEAQRGIRQAEIEGARQVAEAIKASRDAYTEYRRAQVEGARSISEAQRAQADALRSYNQAVREGRQSVADATEAARDAYEAYRLEQVDGAKRIREAEQAVADAREGVNEAHAESARSLAQAQRTVADAARAVKQAEAERARSMLAARRDVSEAYAGIDKARREGAEGVRKANDAAADALETLRETQVDTQADIANALRQQARAAEALAKAQRSAAEAGEEAGARLTASQQRLLDAWKRFKDEYILAMRPANDILNDLGVEILAFSTEYLPLLGSVAERTAFAITASFRHFKSVLRDPAVDAAFRRFANSIPDITKSAGDAFGDLIGTLVIVLGEASPHVINFFNWLEKVTGELLAWASSEKGREKIAKWLEDGATLAEDLGEIFGDLGASLIDLAGDPDVQRFFQHMIDFLGYVAKNADELDFIFETIARFADFLASVPEPVKTLLFYGGAVFLTWNFLGFAAWISGIQTGYNKVKTLAAFITSTLLPAFKKVNKQKIAPTIPAAPTAPGPAVGPAAQGKKLAGPTPVPTTPATGAGAIKAWAARLAFLAAAAGAVVVVVTFDYAAAKDAYSKAREQGKTAGLSAFEGFIEGMKSVPLIGGFFEWYDREFGKLLGKKDRFKDQANTAGAGIAEGIKNGLRGIPIIGPLTSGLLDGVLEWWGIKSPSTKSKEKIGIPIAAGILAGITGFNLLAGFTDKMQKFFDNAGAAWKQKGWSGLGGFTMSSIGGAIKKYNLLGPFSDKVGAFFENAGAAWRKKGWSGLGGHTMESIGKAIKKHNLLGPWSEKVGTFFQNAGEAWKKKGWSGLGSFALDSIGKAIKKYNLLGPWSDKVGTFFQNASEAWKKRGWSGLGSFALDSIGKAIKKYNLLGPWSEKIGTFFQNASEVLKQKGWGGLGSWIIDKIRNAIKGGNGGLIDKLVDMYNRARDFLFDGKWWNVGSDIVAGIRDGITGSWDIGSVLENLARSAWERVKNFFQSKSPSRLMMWLGRTLPQGLAVGIKRDAPQAISEAVRMARSTGEAAREALRREAEIQSRYDAAMREGAVALAGAQTSAEYREIQSRIRMYKAYFAQKMQMIADEAAAARDLADAESKATPSDGTQSSSPPPPPSPPPSGGWPPAGGGSGSLAVNIQMGSITINGMSKQEFMEEMHKETEKVAEQTWRELTERFGSGGGSSGRGL